MPLSPLQPTQPIANWQSNLVGNILNNPLFGTPIAHYKAEHVGAGNFDRRGNPDYLAADPGDYATGVQYVANPDNPLKGIFCQAKRHPHQDKGGIYYVAQMEIYLTENLGDVFVLDGHYPKRQDRFIINGQTYYAVAPSLPCQIGAAIAAYKIELNVERYPVRN